MTTWTLALAFLTALTASAAGAKKPTAPAPKGPAFVISAVGRQVHGLPTPAALGKTNAGKAALGKEKCDYFIVSNISVLDAHAGTGERTVRIHGLLVAVTAWGQPFTGTNMPPKPNFATVSGETLTVILSRTANPSRMRAKYEDTVYEKGKVKSKFKGTALLNRS